MSDENEQKDNVQQMKGPRTRASILKGVEAKLNEARLKAFEAALKVLVEKRKAAEKVLSGIEAEIEALGDEYSDVIPE
jgi:hypothetical protein